MMSHGRRHKGEIRYQEVQGTRSHHKKPPFHGNWKPTVPSWEKRFCYSVGLVPWSKILETKKSMYLYENVVQWNDSACEEAFHNAKSRFWAKINGLPCDISLPDPDIYIDKIDWNSEVDPELYLDLERESEPKHPDGKDKREEVVILDSSLLHNQSFSCNGWGEAEDDLQKVGTADLDPRYGDFDAKGASPNPREIYVSPSNGAVTDNELGNSWKDLDGWKNNCNGWDDHCNDWRQINERNGSGEWDGNTKNREDAGWYMSRYKTSRFNGNDYQMDRGWWRHGRGRKKMNFVY